MKKLIAIAIVFALVTGAAFADMSIAGEIAAKAEVINGNNVKGDDAATPLGTTGITYSAPRISMTYSDGNAGGKLSFQGVSSVAAHHRFAWWKPTDNLRLQFGRDEDGNFGAAQISGWGFTSQAKDVAAFGEYPGPIPSNQGGLGFVRSTGFYPGTGGTDNIQAIFTGLVEGLTINLWIPLKGENAAKTFMKTELNLVYNIEDVGAVRLSFQGNSGYVKGTGDHEWQGDAGVTSVTDSPKVWLSFFGDKLVDQMAFDVGFAYMFPFINNGTEDQTITTNHPVELAVAYRYTGGDFNLKVRTAFTFGGSTKTEIKGLDTVEQKVPTVIGVGILPSYKIGNNTIFFQAGLGFSIVENYKKGVTSTTTHLAQENNALVAWYINPYYHIPVGSNVRFQVGLQVYSDGIKYIYEKDGKRGEDPAKINFAIPVGFYASW